MRRLCIVATLIYAASTSPMWAGYAPGVDQGTVLSANGIAPIPGQGVVTFPGGNTRAAYNFFGFKYFGYGATAINASGVTRAVQNGTDITPATYQYGGVLSIQPDQQQLISDGYDEAGYVGGTCNGSTCVGGPSHAATWNALSNTFEDLHPAGFVSSVAQEIDGHANVVGQATDSAGLLHPVFWSGATPQVLTIPVHFKQGSATAISSLSSNGSLVDVLGGYATTKKGTTHPVVWSGGSGTWTAIDVLPVGGRAGAISAADPADGMARFGGYAMTATSKGRYHAGLWNHPVAGAPNFTDLHPAGSQYLDSWVYCASAAYGLQGGAVLVRSGTTKKMHAMVWAGSATSAVDLQAMLGTNFTQSVVTGIDAYGNAEGAALDTANVWHLVSWLYTAGAN